MIIIEGPDNAGKTTLAGQLAEKYGYFVKHSPGPGEGVELFEWCLSWLLISRRFKGRLLFDRFPSISEQIYGPILREGSAFDQEQLIELGVELMRSSPLIIYCSTFYQNMENDRKNQMEGVVDHYQAIREAYHKFFTPYFVTHGWFSCFDYTREELVRGTIATVEAYHSFLEAWHRTSIEEELTIRRTRLIRS